MTDSDSQITPQQRIQFPVREETEEQDAEPKKRGLIGGFIDSILSKMQASTNWKYAMPSPSSPTTFKKYYTNTDYEKWFKRVPAAHFIVQDMAADSWEKGFHLRGPDGEELTDSETMKIYNVFNDIFLNPFIQACALARLNGQSIVLLGFNDRQTKDWDKPVSEGAKVKYAVAVSSNGGYYVSEWQGIPETPKSVTITAFSNLPTTVHHSRIIYVENTDITDITAHGTSVLEPIGDALSTMQDITWSIGQRVWRAANALITLVGPKGLKPEDAQPILEGWLDINSRFVGFLPANWQLVVHNLGKALGDPSKDFDVLLSQISIGSRVPISVLKGSPKGVIGSKDRDMSDYYQTLSSMQNTTNIPLVKQALSILKKSGQITLPDNFSIQFNPISKRSFRDQAVDIAGETLAKQLDALLKDPETTKAEKMELMKLMMLPGSLQES